MIEHSAMVVASATASFSSPIIPIVAGIAGGAVLVYTGYKTYKHFNEVKPQIMKLIEEVKDIQDPAKKEELLKIFGLEESTIAKLTSNNTKEEIYNSLNFFGDIYHPFSKTLSDVDTDSQEYKNKCSSLKNKSVSNKQSQEQGHILARIHKNTLDNNRQVLKKEELVMTTTNNLRDTKNYIPAHISHPARMQIDVNTKGIEIDASNPSTKKPRIEIINLKKINNKESKAI